MVTKADEALSALRHFARAEKLSWLEKLSVFGRIDKGDTETLRIRRL